MIDRKSISFIILSIVISCIHGQTTGDQDANLDKRISIWGFSKPATPQVAAASPQANLAPQVPVAVHASPITPLPSLFNDPKYQRNSDLLLILGLFSHRTSVEGIVNEFWHNTPSVESCVGCNILIKHMQVEYHNDEIGFKQFFFSICELFKINGEDGGEFCRGFTEIYAPQLFYILENTKLNSEEICATLLTDCLDHYHWFNSPMFWEIKLTEPQLLLNKGAGKIKAFMTPRNSGDQENATTADDNSLKRDLPLPPAPINRNFRGGELFEGAKFLHISDIHLDLLYSLHSTGYCGRILCCRRIGSPAQPIVPPQQRNLKTRLADPSGSYYATMYSNQTVASIKNIPAGYWGSYGNCDLPLRTVKHLINHLSEYIDQIDYIVWSGDSVSHNIWSTDKRQVIETNAILTNLIKQRLLTPQNAFSGGSYQPGRKLVPVVGNHESDVVSM